jgi:predicted DNA-binding protein YlxM (UPF0122 family)
MFEKKMHVDALYDFYGKMLTLKQNEIMDLYCNMDYSLGEISELLGISRQAVHDAIKKTEKTLEHYEVQLGLHERFVKKQSSLETLYAYVVEFEKDGNPEWLVKLKTLLQSELD